MRFTRDWAGNRFPIHCCLLDAECWHDYRTYHMPMRLHLHFLEHSDGHPVYFTLWGKRRSERWVARLFAEGGEWIEGPPRSRMVNPEIAPESDLENPA